MLPEGIPRPLPQKGHYQEGSARRKEEKAGDGGGHVENGVGGGRMKGKEEKEKEKREERAEQEKELWGSGEIILEKSTGLDAREKQTLI